MRFKRIIKILKLNLLIKRPTYRRLIDGDPFATVPKVPYWAWFERIEEVTTL
jgi:hypothetical protein